MTVTVFTTPRCPQCRLTQRVLRDRGIPFRVRDVAADHNAHRLVIDLGYRQAPVAVTDNDHWGGFRPDKIAALASARDLGADGAETN